MRAREYFSLTQGWTLCAINALGRMWPWYISVVTGKGLTNHFLVIFQVFSRGGNSLQVKLVKSPCPQEMMGPTRESALRPQQTEPFSAESRPLAVKVAGGGHSFQ